MSTHSTKINAIQCISDKYFSTVSEDGSLCIWSLNDRERIVQFEVTKSAAVCQSMIERTPGNLQMLNKVFKQSFGGESPLVLVGYSDGSVRVFDVDRKCIVNKIKAMNEDITSINYCQNSKEFFVF